MNAVAAVLAAGASRRLGTPKQLLRLPDGRTLVRRAVEVVQASRTERNAVIVGESREQVVESLGELDVDVVASEDPGEGIAASVRAAAAWARSKHADALLLCLCDQPALSARHLDALLDAWRERRGLVASVYAQKRGVPALFPSSYFGELLALRGDSGATGILRAASRISLLDFPDGARDIDTPEDWRNFVRSTGA